MVEVLACIWLLMVLKQLLCEIFLFDRAEVSRRRLSEFVDAEHGQEGENAQVLDLGFLDHLNFALVNVVLLPATLVVVSQDVGKIAPVVCLLKIVHELPKMT